MDALRLAALEILLEAEPESVTIRDIAERADVSHVYIPQYFGGKAELFADIYPTVTNEAAAALAMSIQPSGSIKPELIRLARLALWLSANHPLGVPATERPLAEALKDHLSSTYQFDDRTSELIVERLIALVIVLAGAPGAISQRPIDLAAHIELELRMLAALASSADPS